MRKKIPIFLGYFLCQAKGQKLLTGPFSTFFFVTLRSHKKNREKTSVINNFSKSSENYGIGHLFLSIMHFWVPEPRLQKPSLQRVVKKKQQVKIHVGILCRGFFWQENWKKMQISCKSVAIRCHFWQRILSNPTDVVDENKMFLRFLYTLLVLLVLWKRILSKSTDVVKKLFFSLILAIYGGEFLQPKNWTKINVQKVLFCVSETDVTRVTTMSSEKNRKKKNFHVGRL